MAILRRGGDELHAVFGEERCECGLEGILLGLRLGPLGRWMVKVMHPWGIPVDLGFKEIERVQELKRADAVVFGCWSRERH